MLIFTKDCCFLILSTIKTVIFLIANYQTFKSLYMPKPKSKIDATENAYAEIDNYINRCIVIDDDERNLYHSLLEKLKVKRKHISWKQAKYVNTNGM